MCVCVCARAEGIRLITRRKNVRSVSLFVRLIVFSSEACIPRKHVYPAYTPELALGKGRRALGAAHLCHGRAEDLGVLLGHHHWDVQNRRRVAHELRLVAWCMRVMAAAVPAAAAALAASQSGLEG